MRYAMLFVGLLAACETQPVTEPAGPNYAAMSCDQLLRTREALEREASLFVSTQGMMPLNIAGSFQQGYTNAAVGGAYAAHGANVARQSKLQDRFRAVNDDIIRRGC